MAQNTEYSTEYTVSRMTDSVWCKYVLGEAGVQAMANLLRVRSMVQQTLARQDAERTNQFLYAASQGDVAKIRQVSP